VLIAGKAFDSPMIHRLLLPLKDEDHMPPDGKPQPTLAELAALQWWIDCGAPADKLVSVGMFRLTDEITHTIRPAGNMKMGKGRPGNCYTT